MIRALRPKPIQKSSLYLLSHELGVLARRRKRDAPFRKRQPQELPQELYYPLLVSLREVLGEPRFELLSALLDRLSFVHQGRSPKRRAQEVKGGARAHRVPSPKEDLCLLKASSSLF